MGSEWEEGLSNSKSVGQAVPLFLGMVPWLSIGLCTTEGIRVGYNENLSVAVV